MDEYVYVVYSYNAFDSSDPEQPFKTQIAWSSELNLGHKTWFDLTMHNLELSDEIYSPFKS